MQGMFAVYQKNQIDGECYLVQVGAIALRRSTAVSEVTRAVAQYHPFVSALPTKALVALLDAGLLVAI